MGYIVGPLISVPTQNSATYTQRTADISAYIGQTVRLVALYQSGTSYRGDIQFDDFNIGGNTFTDFSTSQSFQTNSVADNFQLSNTDYIQADYDNVTFANVGTSTSDYGKFVRDGFGTPSSGTGLTTGKTGSYYLYAETSSIGSNNDFWLRSPEVTVNNGTLSLYTAQYGTNCGPIYIYLEVTSVPTKAVYGLGRYGDSNYGKLPETVRAPLSVVKAGAIYGQQNYGGTTYGSGSISTTHSGVSATGSVTTVTVTADSSVTLPSVSETGSVTTVTVSADGVGNVNIGTAATNNLSPEFDLTLDHVFSEADMSGTTISNGGLNDDYNGNFPGTGQNTVLAFETTLPSSFSSSFDGFLTLGGTGAGTWAGVYNDSGTYKYWVSAGEGATGTGFGSLTDAAADEEAISNIPEFDGGTHTVVLEFRINPGRIRSFIDGRLVLEGNTTGGGALEANLYAGSFREAFGSWGPVRDVSGTGDWSGTIQSDLRVYTGELSDFGTTLTITADATASITGVSATATADPDLVIEADATHTLTSVQGTSATGTVGTVGVAIHEVTGVEGTGQTSTVTTTADSNTSVTGVEATGAVGDAESLVNITAAVTGVESTATIGEIGVFTGLFVTVEVTGLEATGSVTTATVTADAVADNLTGIETTSTVNTLELSGDSNLVTPAVSATTAINDVDTLAQSGVTLASVEGTGQTTTATISGDANFTLVSVEGTGEVTAADASIPKNVDVTGVSTTSSVTTVSVTGTSDTTLPSVSVTGTADPDVVIEGDSLHTITSVQGVSANGGVGDVTAGANVDSVTGVEATGAVTTVEVAAPRTVNVPSVSTTSSINDVTIKIDNAVSISSVDAVAEIEDVVVTADSSLTVSGTEATASVSDVTVIANSVVVFTSAGLTSTVDDATISTEQNIFDANNREHRRVVYVKQDTPRLVVVSNDQSRVVFVPQDVPRIVTVPEDKSRVVSISQDKPRIVYVRAA